MTFGIPTVRKPRRLLGVSLAAAAAGATIIAASSPDAHAAFTLPSCQGSTFSLQGSSFQKTAQQSYWAGLFNGTLDGCGGTPAAPTYISSSSGDGLAAMGGGGGDSKLLCAANGASAPCTPPLAPGTRDLAGSAAATDAPPTPTQQAAMNAGPTGSTADDGLVHVIPVATGAGSIIVHLPAGCDVSGATNGLTGGGDGTGDTAAAQTQRVHIPNALLEKAFAGDSAADTWGELVPGISGTTTDTSETTTTAGITTQLACTDVPVKRIVRSDDSGTTYGTKAFLNLISPTRGWSTTYATTTTSSGSATNAFWPPKGGTGGGVAPTVIASGGCPNSDPNLLCGASGGGGITGLVNTTDGSFGYVDLSTARALFAETSNQTNLRYWLPLQANPSGTPGAYVEPTTDPTAHLAGTGTQPTQYGASCAAAGVSGIPTAASSPNGDPTLGDWSKAYAAGGSSGYPNCILTYMLAWDDSAPVYGNTPTEEAKARSVKDYLTKVVLSDDGQKFTGTDYSALPNGSGQTLLNFARTGAAAIDWNKAGTGGGGGPTTTTTTTTTTPPPPGGGTPAPPTPTMPNAPVAILPPSIPSNAFTLATPKVSSKNKSIAISTQVPGAGKLSVAGSYKSGKKTLKLATVTTSVSSAGTKKLTVQLSSKTRAVVRKAKRLKISLKVTFTPTGGVAKTVTKTVTLKK